jgi:pimeloyl-ACP methyl ester carboxylesterase
MGQRRAAGGRRGTVVLLHGMMSLSGTWWRVGPALAGRGWEVRALDLAGHGSSARLDGPLTIDDLVGGVVSQLVGPVDLLVGHSLGAISALFVAARHPGLVGAVVLEDPPGGAGVDPEVLADGIESDAQLVRTDRDRLLRGCARDNPGWAPSDIEHDVEGIARAQVPALAAGLRGGHWSWDLPALVADAPVPVLLLAAPESAGPFGQAPGSALSGEVRRAVRALLPAGRFVELPGGHALHRDQPGRWLAEVTAFADAVLPRG